MPVSSQQLLSLGATGIGIVLITMVLRASRKAWAYHADPRDFALSWTTGVWLLHLVVTTSLELAADLNPSTPILRACAVYSADMGFHLLTVSICYFLLTCAGLQGPSIHFLVASQALTGAAAITFQQARFYGSWLDGSWHPATQAWIAVDLLFSTIVFLAMIQRLHQARSHDGWLALATSIVGLGLLADSILLAGTTQGLHHLSHYFFAAFLLVMCHLLTYHENKSPTDFQHSSNLEPITGFGFASDAADLAVANDRRRIARDLHDGVGSQLTTILSSLDSRVPHQQAMALALEQCLIDLKMTIDAIESENDSLLDALGRLRYRIQHSLDKLGIRMEWNVEVCAALEDFRGAQARHALRIAQESLANVMRHANATSVRVLCCFLTAENKMVLEVRDNGQGIAPKLERTPTGKGLEGMRQRARDAGGSLDISSATGLGTRVTLTLGLPITRLDLPEPAWATANVVRRDQRSRAMGAASRNLA